MENKRTSKVSIEFIVGIGVIVLLVVGVAIWTQLNDSQSNEANSSDDSSISDNDAVVTIDPETVVARVDGTPILERDIAPIISQITQNALAQGVDPNSPETIEIIRQDAIQTMINTVAARLEAQRLDVEVDESVIDSQIASIIEQAGGQEAFDSQLSEAGITIETIKEDIANDLLIQGLLDQELLLDEIVISDEAIQDRYDSVPSSTPNLPSFEDAQNDIRNQLTFEEEQQLIGDYLESLVAAANIEIL